MIEANTYINSLIHFTTIVQESNKYLDDNKKIEVKIKAQKEGSFIVDLVIQSSNIIDEVKSIFSGDNAEYAANLVGVVTGIYGFAKWLKGNKPDKVENIDHSVKVTNKNGEVTVIKDSIVNIYLNSPLIQEAITQEFETLESDPSVDGFEIQDKNGETVVEIEREEFSLLSNYEYETANSTEQVSRESAILNIVSLSWELNKKWEFYYNGNKIKARIKDDTFKELIDKGESFAKGDSLEAEIEIKQLFDETVNTFVNKGYVITRIIKHIPRSKQSKIDF